MPASVAPIRAATSDCVIEPTIAAVNAATRNSPSIETLTTPEFSHRTPASAPNTSGVASMIEPDSWLATGKANSLPEPAT